MFTFEGCGCYLKKEEEKGKKSRKKRQKRPWKEQKNPKVAILQS